MTTRFDVILKQANRCVYIRFKNVDKITAWLLDIILQILLFKSTD